MSSAKLSTTPIASSSREWISRMHGQMQRVLPPAFLIFALLVNVAWIGLLVYGFATLF